VRGHNCPKCGEVLPLSKPTDTLREIRVLIGLDDVATSRMIRDRIAELVAREPKPVPARLGVAQRCADCGEAGETVGHMDCQYPGRFSERGGAA
jgi:bacterioferritin-associated ferredoxin